MLLALPKKVVAVAGLAAAMLIAGCSKPVAPTARTEANLAGLARLYGEYAARNDNKTPADEAAFRNFLSGLPEGQRRAMGVDAPNAFVSPRDGKPYTVVYGTGKLASLPGQGLRGQPVVVYEQQGQDGKRLAANAQGAVAELTEDELRKATSR